MCTALMDEMEIVDFDTHYCELWGLIGKNGHC